jgi:FlaG/FlaF family flagellin (archaellin)
MKALLHRNPLLASVAVAVLVALAATGYALAFGHGEQPVAPQPHATMMVPF